MADHRRRSGPRRESNTAAVIIALVAALVAGGLFWLTSIDALFENVVPLRVTLNQIAGLIIATGLLTAGWELLGRRRFAEEVLANARLSTEVVDAGILRVTDQYLEDVEWADLFDGVQKLDIVVAYGRTWRNTHRERLRSIARRSGTRLRVFLPDPDDEFTVKVLANRFNMEPEVLESSVEDAIRDFSDLADEGRGAVEVYVRAGDGVFSCYRFDKRAVLTLYSHSKKRQTSVPTFVVRGGKLFNLSAMDWTLMRSQSRQIFPATAS